MKFSVENSLAKLNSRRFDVCFFIFAFIYIYTHLFHLPFTPIYFEGDHLIPVTNALRMFEGERIFTDFFHFIPPGAEVIYYSLFSIFGVKIWVLSFAILLIWLSLTFLILYISKNLLNGWAVYLPALIYLVVGFRMFGIDGSYRLFSIIFALASIVVILNRRNYGSLILAGSLCGAASFFVQTRGVVALAGICVFLIWEGYREKQELKKIFTYLIVISASFLMVVLVTNAYFIWSVGYEVYRFSMVDFIRLHYINDPLAKSSSYLSDFPNRELFFAIHESFAGLFRYFRNVYSLIFYYSLIPGVYIVYLAVRRFWPQIILDEIKDKKLMLLCLTGLFLFAGTSAPTAMRLYQVAVPGIIIFVFLISQLKSLRWTVNPLVIVLIFGAITYSLQRQVVTRFYLDLPAGKASFFDKGTADKYQWVANRTQPGDYFYEAHHPSFYFPLHLKNPTPLYLVRDSDYTPDFQIEQVTRTLQRTMPKIIVWEGKWSKSEQDRIKGDNLAPLFSFLEQNYSKEKEFIVHGEFTLQSTQQIEMWVLHNN